MKRQILLLTIFTFIGFSVAFAQEQINSDIKPGNLVLGKPVSLPKPAYPSEARAARISGQVNVKVHIDTNGNVSSAIAVSGHFLLHKASESAALRARFTPTTRLGIPVKTTGIVSFTFIETTNWENIGHILSNIEEGKIVTANYKKYETLIVQDIGKDGKKELFSLLETKVTNKEIIRAKKLIDLISKKLTVAQPVDLWYFKLGVTRSKLFEFAGKNDKNDLFYVNVTKLKELSESAPNGIPASRLEILKKIVEGFYDLNLTRNQREEVVRLLTESYNKSFGSQ